MPLEYNFKIDGDLLTVTTSGFDDNVDEAVSYGEDIIRHCLNGKCTKILMDESQVSAVLDRVGQYQMVQRLSSIVPHQLSIALLSAIDNLQDTSFGTLVAENRGIKVRLFTSKENALEWLNQQQPE